jgi:hypothetical protein
MATKELTIRVTVPEATAVSTMPAGTYFVPVLGGVYRGVWQRVSQEAVTVPPGTYLSVCLGLLDGLANGADPRYFDDSFQGHVITREQALAILAAQS